MSLTAILNHASVRAALTASWHAVLLMVLDMASAATEEPSRVPRVETVYSWVMPLQADCSRGALKGFPANKQGCRTSRA
jgi:hypothetical protein